MPDPLHPNMFIAADGRLAEYLCHVELLDLTAERAEQLRALHLDHTADCLVLAATELHMP